MSERKKIQSKENSMTVVNIRSAIRHERSSDTFSSSSSSSEITEEEIRKEKKKEEKGRKKNKSKNKEVEEEKREKINLKEKKKEEKEYKVREYDEKFKKEHFGELSSEKLKKIRAGDFKVKKGKKAAKFERQQKENEEKAEHFKIGDFSYIEREEEKEARKAKVGIRVSFAFNIILTIIKIIVLIMSGSISIFASLLDSILDLVSGSIVFIANYFQKLKSKDYYKYPVGKRRLETLAVIVFAAAMFTATSELLIRSVERITAPETINLSFDYFSIGLVTAIIFIKFGLWLLCRRADSPTVQALAQDHINDVFTNAAGILFGILGYYFWSLFDPIGGILLGLFIMINWAGIGLENVQLMTGKSADIEFLSLLTNIAVNHDPRIVAIDTVRAYYVSNRVVVEIDILLPEDMKLREVHDIGESLQSKIEKLPDVERAFVHIDFESEHKHLDEHPTLTNLHAKFNSRESKLVTLEESKAEKK